LSRSFVEAVPELGQLVDVRRWRYVVIDIAQGKGSLDRKSFHGLIVGRLGIRKPHLCDTSLFYGIVQEKTQRESVGAVSGPSLSYSCATVHVYALYQAA
jgi:hypothetical protein